MNDISFKINKREIGNFSMENGIIKKIVRQYKAYLFLSICLVLAATMVSLLPAMIINQFIDMAAAETKQKAYIVILGWLFITVFAAYLLDNARNYAVRITVWKMSDQVRHELFIKSLSQGQKFYNQFSAASFLEHMGNDVDQIEAFFADTLIPVLINILTMAGILVIFFKNSIVLGGIFTLFIFISFAALYLLQKKESDCITEEREASTVLSAFWNEIIGLRKEINVMHKWPYILKRINSMMEELKTTQIKKQKYLYRVWIAALLILMLANTLSLLTGGILYFAGIISLGTVYLLYSYSNKVKEPVENMQLHIQNYALFKSAVERVNSMLQFQDGITDGELLLDGEALSLTVQDVSFSFGDKKVLDRVSFSVGKDETLGIFGKSGAGKSTIGKVICKLYQNQSGEILLNGKRVEEIHTASLRKNTAYITAGDQVYTASLKDNICLFAKYDMDELCRKAEKYHLYRFLHVTDQASMREYLNRMIEPSKLSTGEKQMINALRAVFSEKKLLIFDEAIANIEEKVEKEFYELLDMAALGKTAIIITHNVERLRHCDKIMVMEAGKVIEYGKESILRQQEDSYYSRYSRIGWNNEKK